jgi:hypothetical protein
MSSIDLGPLKEAVDRAHEEYREPPEEGESKPILPLPLYLAEEEWELVWRAVRALRRDHPGVFIQFHEATLANLIIDEFGELESTTTLEGLADRLREIAESEGPWLVSTPLSNITVPEPAMKLADEVVLWRAILGTDWMNERFGGGEDDDNSEFTVHDFLGDRLPRVTRWLRFSSRESVDTRVGAQLLTVEEGTGVLAPARARAKAQYALAVWAILEPPKQWKLLPDLGIWTQQPHLQLGQRFKRREHEKWIPREQVKGNSIRSWGEYEAPGADLLAIPFQAIENLERRSSQALLSAALAQQQASRASRFLLSERIRNIHAAIECLCEPEPGAGGAYGRWEIIANRFGVWDEMGKRGYDPQDAIDVQKRLKKARNIAAHGADAALIDLGYPEAEQRKMQGKNNYALGHDLAIAAVQADLMPLIFAVGHVLNELLLLMRDNDWDDELFEAQFSP